MSDQRQPQTDAMATHHEPVAASYTSLPSRPVQSSCLKDTLNVGMSLVFPCEPMARASSSVGISYASVFLVVMLVYGGGIACFTASAAVDHALFGLSVGYSALAAWILNMAGAVPSIPFVIFCWALAMIDDEVDVEVSKTSQALVVAFLGCQVTYLAVVAYLRHVILARSGTSSGLDSFCCTLCFPCCLFAEAIHRVRAFQEQERANELPAYTA